MASILLRKDSILLKANTLPRAITLLLRVNIPHSRATTLLPSRAIIPHRSRAATTNRPRANIPRLTSSHTGSRLRRRTTVRRHRLLANMAITNSRPTVPLLPEDSTELQLVPRPRPA